MIHKDVVEFKWALPAGYLNKVCIEDFTVENGDCGNVVSMELHAKGQEGSRLLKCDHCSLFLHKPKFSVLLARVCLGDIVRELLSTSHGIIGWTNFCPSKLLQAASAEFVLEVVHLGIFPPPTVRADSADTAASWDLRGALGGLSYKVGQQFAGDLTLGSVQLRLVYFPGGHVRAPANHTSLWVSPVVGLEDRRYRVVIDGTERRGDGESVLHFPRAEDFGDIHLVLDPSRDSSGPSPAITVGTGTRSEFCGS